VPAEQVVVVAHDHMPGVRLARDGAGDQAAELLGGIGGDHIGGAAADEQGRHPNALRRPERPVERDAALRHLRQLGHPRVPVPVPAAVVAQPDGPADALRPGAPRPVRRQRRERVRRLVERRVAGRARGHERPDPAHPRPRQARDDVGQDQATRQRRELALGQQGRHAAHRRAHEHRRLADLADHRLDVTGHRGRGVIPGRVPRAVAVPARVDGDRPPPGRRDQLAGAGPRMPRLPAPVQQQHPAAGRRAGGHHLVGDQRQPVRVEGEPPHGGHATLGIAHPLPRKLRIFINQRLIIMML
jgi:hypothetical protein